MLKNLLQQKLNRIWYGGEKSALSVLLIPLSWLYRCFLFFRSILKFSPYRSTIPVLVVGNLTAGGNGKTPALIALVELLKSQGKKVGVVSRAYPLNPPRPILIDAKTTPQSVGDEPFLIHQKTGVPVCVCRDRVAAIRVLEPLNLDFILSDDGLQNHSFYHDQEIVLVDASRQFGNKRLLPAGPLREPLTRLKTVDYVVEKTFGPDASEKLSLVLQPGLLKNLATGHLASPEDFQGKKVVAMTAIASPESFFNTLKALGLSFEAYPFYDHYAFQEKDFSPFADAQIVMTEKDGVKCAAFADTHFWILPLEARFSQSFLEKFKL